MFGGGASQQPGGDAVEGFKQQVKMMDKIYMRLLEQCKTKCIPSNKYHEGELNKGESVCVDRCVHKYFEVFEKIGQSLTEKGMEQSGASLA